jgi:hypothetical protein
MFDGKDSRALRSSGIGAAKRGAGVELAPTRPAVPTLRDDAARSAELVIGKRSEAEPVKRAQPRKLSTAI